MRNERSSVRGERGASLIEILVAVVLLGAIVVGVLAAMGTSIRTSDYHRKRTEVESVLVSAAERIKEVPHEACATPATSSYLAAAQGAARDPGPEVEAEEWDPSTVRIVSIQYWNGTTYGSTCYDDAAHALRLQRIELEVVHPSGDVQKQLELVKGVLD